MPKLKREVRAKCFVCGTGYSTVGGMRRCLGSHPISSVAVAGYCKNCGTLDTDLGGGLCAKCWDKGIEKVYREAGFSTRDIILEEL